MQWCSSAVPTEEVVRVREGPPRPLREHLSARGRHLLRPPPALLVRGGSEEAEVAEGRHGHTAPHGVRAAGAGGGEGGQQEQQEEQYGEDHWEG